MDAQTWSKRVDYANERANYDIGTVISEEASAMSLGFDSASDYWDASREAFTESVRDDEAMEGME